MFYINHEYLSQLDNPHEAISEDVWRSWRSQLLDKSVTSDEYNTLLSMGIKTIATNAGVLWRTDSGDNIGEILKQDFVDIRTRKHVGTWIKKAITLTFAKLVEFNDEEVKKIITLPPNEKEVLEVLRKDEYNNARIKINHTITNMRKILENDNYEQIWKQFIVLVLHEIAVIGGYSEERLRRYLPVAMDRFYYLLPFKDIATKNKNDEGQDMQQGVINSIIKRLSDDFSEKLMATADELEIFDKKLIAFYEQAYITLDDTDKEIWAKRLDLIKTFRKYFVGRTLDE
jgi:hypothetical protein